MLKLASQMDDDTRIKCALAGLIAVDENCDPLTPESKPVRLRRSNGHRKAGRPTKYYLYGLTINAIVIEAYTDEEALSIANENYITPQERPEFPIYYDSHGNEHAEF